LKIKRTVEAIKGVEILVVLDIRELIWPGHQ